MRNANILHQGVTIYSFSHELRSFQYSFEDCMQLASQLGDRGVELVGPMHRGAFPEATNEFERTFKSSVARYGLTPTCYAAYVDRASHRDSNELFEFMLLQLKSAFRLGFPVIRIQPADDYVDRLLPFAEKYKVKMGYEIHAPMALGKDPETIKLIEYIKKISSPYLGIIPDGGIFADKIPSVVTRYVKSKGVTEATINQCITWREANVPVEKAVAEAKKMTDAKNAVWTVNMFYGNSPQTDPEELRKVMSYVMHFHAKFWDLENGQVSAIPYEHIIRVLGEEKFSGWLSTEYEGHLFNTQNVDAFGIIKQFQERIRELGK